MVVLFYQDLFSAVINSITQACKIYLNNQNFYLRIFLRDSFFYKKNKIEGANIRNVKINRLFHYTEYMRITPYNKYKYSLIITLAVYYNHPHLYSFQKNSPHTYTILYSSLNDNNK